MLQDNSSDPVTHRFLVLEVASVVRQKLQPLQECVKSDFTEEEGDEVSNRVVGNPLCVLPNLIVGEIVHDSRKTGASQGDAAEPGSVNVPENISSETPIDQGVDADPLLQGVFVERLVNILIESKASDNRLRAWRASTGDLCQAVTRQELAQKVRISVFS